MSVLYRACACVFSCCLSACFCSCFVAEVDPEHEATSSEVIASKITSRTAGLRSNCPLLHTLLNPRCCHVRRACGSRGAQVDAVTLRVRTSVPGLSTRFLCGRRSGDRDEPGHFGDAAMYSEPWR